VVIPMLVSVYLHEFYQKFVNASSSAQKTSLDQELDSLKKWGERRSVDVKEAQIETRQVPSVYPVNGEPREVLVEKRFWPLEDANKHLLSVLDERIVASCKELKGAGIVRPTMILQEAFFLYLLTQGDEKKYVQNPKAWYGVNLVLHRLRGTARLAARFENPEMFGPRITYGREETTIEYTKEAWRGDLARRGLVPKRRGGKNADRDSAISRGEMRQMPVTVPGEEVGQKRQCSGAKGLCDVPRKVRGARKRKGVSELQQDLPALQFSPKNSRHEDGKG